MIHSLKCWPEFFQATKRGDKTFEIRKADRPYAVGDFLDLHEYDPCKGEFTAEPPIMREVTYILDNPVFVQFGTVCMAIRPTLPTEGVE